MAESYITRRGSASGGGSLGNLNVYIGSSPPQDNVGLFINSSTISTNDVYIAPNGFDGPGLWSFVNGTTPVNLQSSFPAIVGDSAYISYYTNTLYKFDSNSESFTSLSTPINWIKNYVYTFLQYTDNGLIFGTGTSGNSNAADAFAKYDIESDVWSQAGGRLTESTAVIYGSCYYNGLIYIVTRYARSSTSGDQIVVSYTYDPNSSTVSTIMNVSGYQPYGTLALSVVFQSPHLYIYGGDGANTQCACDYNIQANTQTVFKTPYQSNSNYNRGVPGYCVGNELHTFVPGTQMDIQTALPASFSNEWTESSHPVPTVSNYRQATCWCANFGNKVYLLNIGASYQNIAKLTVTTDGYPTNSIIIETGSTSGEAELISENKVVVRVENVYYVDNSGNMTNITEQCQVRKTGEQWTAIS